MHELVYISTISKKKKEKKEKEIVYVSTYVSFSTELTWSEIKKGIQAHVPNHIVPLILYDYYIYLKL